MEEEEKRKGCLEHVHPSLYGLQSAYSDDTLMGGGVGRCGPHASIHTHGGTRVSYGVLDCKNTVSK